MQRLSSPALVTDSMSSGGEVHDRLSMSAPGSPPISPMPQPFEMLNLDVNGGLPQASGPEIPVSDQAPRDGLGRFSEDFGAWSQPGNFPEGGADKAGWSQT